MRPLVLASLLTAALAVPTPVSAAANTFVGQYGPPTLLLRSLGSGWGVGYGVEDCVDLTTARLAINDEGRIAMVVTCRLGAAREAFVIVDEPGVAQRSHMLPANSSISRISTDDSGQFTYAVNGGSQSGVYAYDASLGIAASSQRLLTAQPDGACVRHSPVRLPDDRARFVAERCSGSSRYRGYIESDGISGPGRTLLSEQAWGPDGHFDWLSEPGQGANGWLAGFGHIQHFVDPVPQQALIALSPLESSYVWRIKRPTRNNPPGFNDVRQDVSVSREGDSAALYCFNDDPLGHCTVLLHYNPAPGNEPWSAQGLVELDYAGGVSMLARHAPVVRRVNHELHALTLVRKMPMASGADMLVSVGARSPGGDGSATAATLLREGDTVMTDRGPATIARQAGERAIYDLLAMNARGDALVVANLRLIANDEWIGQGLFQFSLDELFADGFDYGSGPQRLR